MATVVMQFPTVAERTQRARAAADRRRLAWREDAGFLRLLPVSRTRVEIRDQRSFDPDTTGPEAA